MGLRNTLSVPYLCGKIRKMSIWKTSYLGLCVCSMLYMFFSLLLTVIILSIGTPYLQYSQRNLTTCRFH